MFCRNCKEKIKFYTMNWEFPDNQPNKDGPLGFLYNFARLNVNRLILLQFYNNLAEQVLRMSR